MFDKTIKNEKNIIIPKNIFILNNLFEKDDNNSKVSKVWSLILNFHNEEKFFEYINLYLLPIESKLIEIFEEKIYKKLNDFEIKKIIELTNQLMTFCNDNSILWQDALGKSFNNISEKDNYLEK